MKYYIIREENTKVVNTMKKYCFYSELRDAMNKKETKIYNEKWEKKFNIWKNRCIKTNYRMQTNQISNTKWISKQSLKYKT